MFIDEETEQQILARATLEATLDKYSVRAPGYTPKRCSTTPARIW